MQIVTNISSIISDETKEYIRTEANDTKTVKLWGENIQCHYIPYKPVKKPLAKLTTKPATRGAFVTDFSMKYNTAVNNNKENNVTSSSSKPASKVSKASYNNCVCYQYK